MYQFILLIHVFAALFIVGLVLVQQGKGASMGAAFGSGASQTVFGSRGSGSFLFRLTIGLISVFFVTSITLNYIVAKAYKQESVFNLPVQAPINQKPVAPENKTDNQVPMTNSGTSNEPSPNELPVRN